MKKLIIVSFMLFLSILSTNGVYAGDYQTYEEITFKNKGVKLIEDYNQKDYKEYYKKIKKRRFWGWKTITIFDGEKTYFTKETLYVISNAGTTPITETFSFKTEKTLKKQISATGNIGISGSGSKAGFKLGLEKSLKTTASISSSSLVEEKVSIRVDVDPNTKLLVQIKGEGKITNGVAKYYSFWKNVKKGGFEIFIVSSEYYSLEKVPLDEE